MTAPQSFPPCRTPEPTRDLDQLRRDIAECGFGILLDALEPELTSLRSTTTR